MILEEYITGPLTSNGPVVKKIPEGDNKINLKTLANTERYTPIKISRIKLSYNNPKIINSSLNNVSGFETINKIDKIKTILTTENITTNLNNTFNDVQKQYLIKNIHKITLEVTNKTVTNYSLADNMGIKHSVTDNLKDYLFKSSVYRLVIKPKLINRVMYPKTLIPLVGKKTKPRKY